MDREGTSRGHQGADSLGAHFSRSLIAVDYAAGFEARAAQADSVTRYAAFLADVMARYRSSPTLREEQPDLRTPLQAEERRVRTNRPNARDGGERLRREATR